MKQFIGEPWMYFLNFYLMKPSAMCRGFLLSQQHKVLLEPSGKIINCSNYSLNSKEIKKYKIFTDKLLTNT